MSKVSVIIPSRNERYLAKTVEDIYEKATGDFEVIIAFDGPPYQKLPNYPNLSRLCLPEPIGLRKCINMLAEKATGRYLLKTDAHCMFDRGFDEKLKTNCEKDWIVVPRIYVLNADLWELNPNTPTDYYYLSCPWTYKKYFVMQSCFWYTRTNMYIGGPMIDDIMTFQGSLWFMHKDYWKNKLHGLSENDFGPYAEHQEIGLKTWLGGGRIIVNKNTWYAHNGRGGKTRGYHRSVGEFLNSHAAVADYFANNKWSERVHDFSWLIEKFWPLPVKETVGKGELFYWPENWQDFLNTTELCRLAYWFGSDKCPQIKYHYTPYYYTLLKDRQNSIKKVLEIGVGSPELMPHCPNYKKGASLYMWRGFFPKAQIYGADILPELVFKDERIETFQCNQSKKKDLKKLIAKIGPDIDLVIDDGSHLAKDQVFTCLTLMPMLKKDIIYVIEDVADLGIIEKLKDYDSQYKRFKHKSTWNDRMVVVRNKQT